MFDLKKMEEEQSRIAKKVILKDSFDSSNFIGGVDSTYHEKLAISAIVIWDTKKSEIIEKVYAVQKAKVPYISGFLAFREGPSISEAFSKLNQKPDLMMFDGNGILHPRRCGLACHMGVLLDVPSIGVAKSMMFGQEKDGTVYEGKEALAKSYVSREYAKPMYISPGHRISLKTSFELVKKTIRPPHKLPEPLHQAHRYVSSVRELVVKGDIKQD